MNAWHIVTSEYPPDVGGVSDYTGQVAEALARSGDEVHVWCAGSATEETTFGVQVHRELGSIRSHDLRRVNHLLDRFPAPRRLLVQWVPHGFGYHSMNVWFCLWLARRARSGDYVELMVHEPFLRFGRGPLRHAAMALVHRLMTLVLLRVASRVWISIPAWEGLLRPYALGRHIPMDWLPVPGCLPRSTPENTRAIRELYAADEKPLIGHFGSFGSAVSILLEELLLPIMENRFQPSLLLLGAGSEGFRNILIQKHPAWSARVHASGYKTSTQLAAHIAACDLFVQPYPDGITSRRTTAMACLSEGRPVVTTRGQLTEPLWAETGAVALAAGGDTAGFASDVDRLLADDPERRRLGDRGRALHCQRFDVEHIIAALKTGRLTATGHAPDQMTMKPGNLPCA